jgi:RNA polymerase sigma-70 factor (ECF subfamily)
VTSSTAILDGLRERGQQRWPAIVLSSTELAEHVRARVPSEETWATLHAEDLYLACACVLGRAGAPEAFTAAYGDSLLRFCRRVEPGAEAARDRAQELMVHLLVGDGQGGPKLASYSGRGPLAAWLRMVVTRRSLNSARDARRHAEAYGRLVKQVVDDADPEIAIIRARYAEEFKGAFRDALATLGAEERALLRLHYGEGLALDAIASLNGWSKPTASRRVADAREAILQAARQLLGLRLRVTPPELESLMRVMRSDLDLSLIGQLR